MNLYEVQVTPHAAAKLAKIYEYIAFELMEPVYAQAQFDNLTTSIQSLDTMPKRCKVYNDMLYPDCEIRRLLVDNYSVFYYIAGQCVIVTDILYSRSDMLERLKDVQI